MSRLYARSLPPISGGTLTHVLHPKDLTVSSWLSGPEFLRNPSVITTPGTDQAILSPNDPELRTKLKPLTTSVKSSGSPTLETERFKRHSSWPSLRRTIAIPIAKVKSLKERDKPSQNARYHHQSPKVIDRATKVIIKAVQGEAFKDEFEVIAQSSPENDCSRNEAKARKKVPEEIDSISARPRRCRYTEIRRPPSSDQLEFQRKAPSAVT